MTRKWPKAPGILPSAKYVYRIDVEGIPRYIGAGTGARAWSHFSLVDRRSQVPFHKFLAKLEPQSDVTVHIIKDGLSDNAAHVLESALISSYGRVLLHEGTLLNMGDGGRFNGQRMHTARELYLQGERSPFGKQPTRRRKRPPKSIRVLQQVAYGADFGSKVTG